MKTIQFTRNAKIPGDRLGQTKAGSVRSLEDDLANEFIEAGTAFEMDPEDYLPKPSTKDEPLEQTEAPQAAEPEPEEEKPKKPGRRSRKKKDAE